MLTLSFTETPSEDTDLGLILIGAEKNNFKLNASTYVITTATAIPAGSYALAVTGEESLFAQIYVTVVATGE